LVDKIKITGTEPLSIEGKLPKREEIEGRQQQQQHKTVSALLLLYWNKNHKKRITITQGNN